MRACAGPRLIRTDRRPVPRWPRPTTTAVARTCSLIFMVLDVLKPLGHKKILENELEGYGIRLNVKPPQITFRKKEKGGLSISSTVRGPPAWARVSLHGRGRR